MNNDSLGDHILVISMIILWLIVMLELALIFY